jgi:DNA polymerase III subunit gamma/tau
MLTQDYRPTRFEDVRGQRTPVAVMRGVAKNPESKPRTFLFHGEYGTGKTSLARIFARALNCENMEDEPCGRCAACQAPLDYSPFYHEYDCGAVGSVEDIRILRDDLVLDSSLAKYRVVVFDEFHLASKQAQSALLKVLEELKGNTFVVFCTTDLERILDTVQSRSVELFFDVVEAEDVQVVLEQIAQAEGMVLTDRIRRLILSAAMGHVRDAVKLMELLKIVGDEEFVREVVPVEDTLLAMLAAVRKGDRELFQKFLDRVMHTLLARIQAGFYSVLELLVRSVVCGTQDEGLLGLATKLWGPDVFKLFRLSMSPGSVEAFRSDVTLQAFFWTVWYAFNRPPTTDTAVPSSRFRRKGESHD